jgi:hypothetical protein
MDKGKAIKRWLVLVPLQWRSGFGGGKCLPISQGLGLRYSPG